MKKYCFNCGARLEFSPKNMPKFCQNCGKALNPLASSEDKDDVDNLKKENFPKVPTGIHGLDVEFDNSSLIENKITLGSLMGTLDKNDISKETRQSDAPEASREEFLEAFEKEAGTSREKAPDRKNDQT